MRRDGAAMLARVGLGASPDTEVERLAPGERQLVEIAEAPAPGTRIVIPDEPNRGIDVGPSTRSSPSRASSLPPAGRASSSPPRSSRS